jgi:hypothetical protein
LKNRGTASKNVLVTLPSFSFLPVLLPLLVDDETELLVLVGSDFAAPFSGFASSPARFNVNKRRSRRTEPFILNVGETIRKLANRGMQ